MITHACCWMTGTDACATKGSTMNLVFAYVSVTFSRLTLRRLTAIRLSFGDFLL